METIKEDIQWLGYQWGNEYYALRLLQQLWDFAIRLIKEGKAYIDEQTAHPNRFAIKGAYSGVKPLPQPSHRGDTRTLPKDEYRQR